MEKWKIAVIAALLLSLVGFGMYQQKVENTPTSTPDTQQGTPTPSPYLGKTLPAWNFKTWSGKPTTLASLRGKLALVEIFRIQCPHCQDAAPFMVGVQKRYGPRGLQMVGIQSPGNLTDSQNPENNWKAVQAWMKEFGINYPVAFDPGSKYFQGTIKDAIFGGKLEELRWPTTLLLDKEGKVIMGHNGYSTQDADDIAKIVEMAVNLEKVLPGKGTPQENAASLVQWLKDFLPNLAADDAMLKALTDDIAQRLK